MSFLFEEEEIIEEVSTTYDDVQHYETIKEKVEMAHDSEPVLDKPKSIFVDLQEKEQFNPSTTKKDHQPAFTIEKEQSKRSEKHKTQPNEYEFSASISPIFGKKQQPEKPVIMVQPKIELETSESVLGTIISPIYGIKKGKSPTKQVEKVKPVATMMSLEDILGVNPQEEDKITQLSLETEQENESNKEDMLMQLFEEEQK